MIEVVITRLRVLPEKQRLALPGAAVDTATPGAEIQAASARTALVRSAFECPPAGRAKVESAIRACLGANVAIRFETSPGLVCGIELTLDGVKLAWSVADYLSSLAQDVTALAATDLATAAAPPTRAPKETADVH